MLKPAWVLRLTEAFHSFLFPEGCPGFCNNNGRCTLEASGWHCICQPGWRGAGCHVAMETLCTDGKDNEGGMSVRMNCSNVQRASPRKARLQRCRTLTSTSFLRRYPLLAWSFCREDVAPNFWVTFSVSVCFMPRTLSCLSDGLVDCLDPDCCLQLSCQNHLYCKGSPDPVEVLSQSPSSLDPQRVKKGTNECVRCVVRHKQSIKHAFFLSFLGCQVFLSAHSLFSWTRVNPHRQWRQSL